MPQAPKAPRQHFWWIVGLIAVAGLAIRLASVWAWYRQLPLALDDNYYYHHQARLLADGRGFANPFFLRNQHVVAPSAAHPPLYSLYLAAWTLLGAGGVTDHRVAACLLGASICVPLAIVGRRLAGKPGGVIAAGFGAIYPPLWINDGLLLSETLAGVLVAWVIVAALAVYDRPTNRRWAVLGGLSGLAGLSRSELLGFVFVLIIPLAITVARRPNDRSHWIRSAARTATIGTIGAGLVVAPWVIRNMATFERPTTLSTGAGFVLEIANCDATYSGSMIGYWSPDCMTTPRPPSTDESVIEAALRTTGTEYISTHTKRFIYVAGIRVLRAFHLFNPAQGADFDTFFERRPAPAVTMAMWSFYATSLLAIGGLVALMRRDRSRAGSGHAPTNSEAGHVDSFDSNHADFGPLWTLTGRQAGPAIALIAPIALAVAATAGGIGITRYRAVADVAMACAAAVGLRRLPQAVPAAISRLRTDGLPWLQRRWVPSVVAMAVSALALRWFVILVTWPTCDTSVDPRQIDPYSGCFRVWGDALYSSVQGILNGRGHFYQNGIEWEFSKILSPSAGDPPMFSGLLGLVGAFGRDETPDWVRFVVGSVLVISTVLLCSRFFGRKWAIATGIGVAGLLSMITVLGGESAVTQRLFGAVFGVVAVVFIALSAKELGGPLAGIVAGSVATIHPLLWINDSMLMSESPYLAFLSFGLWAALKYWRHRTWGWALSMATGIAFASATRAEASTLFVLMVLPLILRTTKIDWRRRLMHLGAAALIAILTLGPWLVWNSQRFAKGNLTTMTTGTGSVLGSASCDRTYYGEAMGYWSNCILEPFTASATTPTKASTLVVQSLHTDEYNRRIFAMCGVTVGGNVITDADFVVPAGGVVEVILPRRPVDPTACPTGQDQAELDESESDGLVRGIAVDYISAHKDRLPVVAVLRVARMMSLYHPFQTWRWDYQIEGRGYWSSGIGMWMWWAMALPAVGALWWLFRRKLPVLPFFAIVASIAITAAGTFGINRYRVPADMVEIVLFGIAIAALVRWGLPDDLDAVESQLNGQTDDASDDPTGSAAERTAEVAP